jgi:Asp-tRNA(Asn)/Glu-tRNA(Gln) amidotransferase A subunit family amidase
MFHEAVKQLQSIGGVLTPIDWSPFEKAGRLLYDGTFVSERLASLPDDFLEKNAQHLHPVILELFKQVEARNSTAVQAYRDLQAKALYTRQAEEVLGYSGTGVNIVLVPTTVTHWKTAELLADPIKKNSSLGVSLYSRRDERMTTKQIQEFTHCGNVLDLCALSVPAGEYDVSELSGNEEHTGKLPFGVMFLGSSRMDAETLELARRFEASFAAKKV